MKKNNIFKNIIIILLITAAILYFVLRKDYHEIMSLLTSVKVEYVLIAVLIYLIYFMLDQLAFYKFIKNYNEKATYKFTLYVGIVTKFFNGITPLATGGQPMQVYELHKSGMNAVNSTNAVVLNLMAFKCAYIFLTIVLFIIDRAFDIFNNIPVLRELTIIGFVINIFLLIVMFMFSFSKDLNKKIIGFIVKLITKIFKKIDKAKVTKKINDTCDEFYENAKSIAKNKILFVKCILIQLVSLLFYFSIPYVLCFAFNIHSLSIFNSIIAGMYVYIMGCSVPLPGSSGGMEYGFYGYYGKFIEGSSVGALMLLWRTLTFYIPTILGAIILGIHKVKGDKK